MEYPFTNAITSCFSSIFEPLPDGFVMPLSLGARGITFSGCPSVHPFVRPKPEIPSFHLYMGPLVHLTNKDRFSRGGSNLGFPGISWRTHGGNSLKCCMLMYPDHLQDWLDFGHDLLISIFLLLASLWPSETVQIWGRRHIFGALCRVLSSKCFVDADPISIEARNRRKSFCSQRTHRI